MENQDVPPDQENAPKASGLGKNKLLIGILVVGVGVTGYAVLRTSSTAKPAGGTIFEAPITLVTADRTDVDCALDTAIEGLHCAFASPEKPWTIDEKQKLQPFYTLDRRLFLIPGLFLEPPVELRFKAEPPTKPREQLARFTARCKLRIHKTIPNVRVRWSSTAAFSDPMPAEFATVVDCKIEG